MNRTREYLNSAHNVQRNIAITFSKFVTLTSFFSHHLCADIVCSYFSCSLFMILVFSVQRSVRFNFLPNEATHSCAYHNRICNVHIFSHWSFYIEIEYSTINHWIECCIDVGTLIGRWDVYSICTKKLVKNWTRMCIFMSIECKWTLFLTKWLTTICMNTFIFLSKIIHYSPGSGTIFFSLVRPLRLLCWFHRTVRFHCSLFSHSNVNKTFISYWFSKYCLGVTHIRLLLWRLSLLII